MIRNHQTMLSPLHLLVIAMMCCLPNMCSFLLCTEIKNWLHILHCSSSSPSLPCGQKKKHKPHHKKMCIIIASHRPIVWSVLAGQMWHLWILDYKACKTVMTYWQIRPGWSHIVTVRFCGNTATIWLMQRVFNSRIPFENKDKFLSKHPSP